MLMSKADSDQMQTSSDANCLKDSTNSLSKASLKVTKLQQVDLAHVYCSVTALQLPGFDSRHPYLFLTV